MDLDLGLAYQPSCSTLSRFDGAAEPRSHRRQLWRNPLVSPPNLQPGTFLDTTLLHPNPASSVRPLQPLHCLSGPATNNSPPTRASATAAVFDPATIALRLWLTEPHSTLAVDSFSKLKLW